jgi:1,4-alpha-glucan branching enzyme
MHDTLDYAGRDPIYRGYHHNQMTFSLMYAFSENFVLPLSHDEVVHGKGSLWARMPGDDWNKAANLRALLAYMWAHPGKQLLFQGGEFGQEREWSEARSLDWDLLDEPLHAGVKALVGDLNRAYRAQPALWTKDFTPDGFSWIDANDASGNVLSFLRHGLDADGKPTVLACVANLSGSPKQDYRVGLPFAGRWREVLNTDAEAYGGSGVGNLGAVEAEPQMWHGRPASAVLQLPPAGVLWLVPEPFEGAVRRRSTTSMAVPTEVDPLLAEAATRPEDDVVDSAPAAPVTEDALVAPPQPDVVEIMHGDPVLVDPEFDDDPAAIDVPTAPDAPGSVAQASDEDVVLEEPAVAAPPASERPATSATGSPRDLESGADDSSATQ